MTSAEWDALRLSLEVGVFSTLLALPLAIAAAWLLARRDFVGKSVVDALIHAPLVLPPVVIGYLLLITFGTRGPVGAWLLEHLGLRLIFTVYGAILAASVMAFPLMVRAIRLSLESVDRGLEQAARTLGAAPLDVFASITLPLMLPGIVSGSLLGFARSLGEFGATITFASNIEGQTRTLPLALYTATQTPGGDAMAMRLVVISIVLAIAALVASDWLERRVRRMLGR